MTSLKGRAPAKINLTLAITGRRDDGYHLMDSLVMFADLCDTITLTPAAEPGLSITGPYAPALNDTSCDDNIIMKAIRAFCDAADWPQHFHVTLDKHIPVAAGIGGGSSDAAAVLNILNSHAPSPCDDDVMHALGLSLGADVPVCLAGLTHHFWRMRGIGEVLDRVDYPPSSQFGMILMNPGIPVPTGTIFNALSAASFDDAIIRGEHDTSLTKADFLPWLDDGNTLEKPAATLYQEVRSAVDMMAALDHHDGFITSGMSGSGATVFALFDSTADAERTYDDLKGKAHWSWVGGVFTPSLNH